MNFDIKDKKIIYELVKDARITNSAIAKKVNLNKNSVGYRIKQLEKNELIRGYRAIIDVNKLNYQIFRVYINFIDLNEQKLEEVISFLKQNKKTWWIARLDGSWSFLFAYHAKSNKDFYDFYYAFLQKYRKYVKEKLISPLIFYRELPKRYLMNEQEIIKIEPSDIKIEIDEKDKHLLKILSKNGKSKILDLSKELDLDIKTIKRKIKKLEEKKVILGYTADIDTSKLGRDIYTIQVDLNNYDRFKQIREEIISKKETSSWVISIGGHDLECDLEIEKTQRFYELTNELKTKFEEIREINYFRIIKSYKIQYVPDDI